MSEVVVLLRTLNEEKNIDRFLECYAGADKILVADGGSTDETVARAWTYDNVEVRYFHQGRDFDGHFWNDQPAHLNFLIDWAMREHDPTWLIFDDCDCVPTVDLGRDMRDILSSCPKPVVCAYRLYVCGESDYFPTMSMAGQSLWAWKPKEALIRGDTSLPVGRFGLVGIPGHADPRRVDLKPPYCLLHYFAPTPEETALKWERYAARGTPQDSLEESEYWPPQPLPEWAVPFKERKARMSDEKREATLAATITLATMMLHKARISAYLHKLAAAIEQRAIEHDLSKLRPIEFPGFVELNEAARAHEYGSPGYNASLERGKAVIDVHYQHNAHHPEHHACGVDDMRLLDLIEMVADWQAAADAYGNSNFEDGMSVQIERFGLTPEQVGLIELVHDAMTARDRA